MQNLTPLPDYSLYDLFRDINTGHKKFFTYKDVLFIANRTGLKWIVENKATGHKATCPFYFGSMTDFHGIAAALLNEKKDILFTKQGEIIP